MSKLQVHEKTERRSIGNHLIAQRRTQSMDEVCEVWMKYAKYAKYVMKYVKPKTNIKRW